MKNPEIFGSQESIKNRLIESGIAEAAIVSLFDKDFLKYMNLLGLYIDDFNFKAGYASYAPDKPQIIVDIPNLDSSTQDRVPMRRFFISDKTRDLSGNLNEEQNRILTEMCDEAGVVAEEPDDLIKEALAKNKK